MYNNVSPPLRIAAPINTYSVVPQYALDSLIRKLFEDQHFVCPNSVRAFSLGLVQILRVGIPLQFQLKSEQVFSVFLKSNHASDHTATLSTDISVLSMNFHVHAIANS